MSEAGNHRSTALISTSAVSILILLVIIYSTGYGFDITDEGYYYINYEFAGLYQGNSLTLFGPFYQWFYEALGKNIQIFRSLDILVIYLMSLIVVRISFTAQFSSILAKYFGLQKAPILLSIFCASFSFLLYHIWLLSPNYNTLSFVSCLLLLLGFLLLRPIYSISSIKVLRSLKLIERLQIAFSPITIGVGLSLAWVAKPTTFAALFSLVLLSLCYLYFGIKIHRNWLIIAFKVSCVVVFASLGLFILFHYSTFRNYLAEVASSLHYYSILASGHTSLWHSISKLLSVSRLIFAASFLAVLQLVVFKFLVVRHLPKIEKSQLYFLRSLFLFLSSLLFCVIVSRTSSYSDLAISGLFAFPFVLFLCLRAKNNCLIAHSSEIVSSTLSTLNQQKYSFFISSLAFVLPLAFAIGTNVGYEGKFASAFIIILIGAIELVQRQAVQNFEQVTYIMRTFCLSMILPCFCLLLLIGHGLYAPYRQNSNFFSASQYARIHSTDLKFSDSVAQFYRNLSSVLSSNGFDEGTPVLDLTHGSPGLIYAFKGFPVGRPWMLRGYPGGNASMLHSLKGITCKEASSIWIFADKNELYSNPEYLSGLAEISIIPLDSSRYELIYEGVFHADHGFAKGEKEKSRLLIFRPLPRQCD